MRADDSRCRHDPRMVVKKLGKRGGVYYRCDPERNGCGQKVAPGRQRKLRRDAERSATLQAKKAM